MINNYINHIVFVIDRSGSMSSLSNEVVKVFDSQIEHLALRSKELDQETRVSVYLFADTVECLVYDKDCLRLPSLAKFYRANGNTALIDGAIKAIDDLEKTATLYGDHSFLVYVLTDGQENRSQNSVNTLSRRIGNLPDNWTMGVLVPDERGVDESKRFGFPQNNIQVWSTTNNGIREVGEVIRKTNDNFLRARATGVRGTKSLFNLDASSLKSSTVKNNLNELNVGEYDLFAVTRDSVIKDFVESWTQKPYIKGSAYYMLSKPEAIQSYKQVCIQDKRNGRVYSGTNARRILSLPDFEVKVNPVTYGDFDIFVQSTSTNRKLIKGTKIIVLK